MEQSQSLRDLALAVGTIFEKFGTGDGKLNLEFAKIQNPTFQVLLLAEQTNSEERQAISFHNNSNTSNDGLVNHIQSLANQQCSMEERLINHMAASTSALYKAISIRNGTFVQRIGAGLPELNIGVGVDALKAALDKLGYEYFLSKTQLVGCASVLNSESCVVRIQTGILILQYFDNFAFYFNKQH